MLSLSNIAWGRVMTTTKYCLPVFETVGLALKKIKGAKVEFWKGLGLFLFAGVVTSELATYLGKIGYVFLGALLLHANAIFSTLLGWGLLYMGIQRATNGVISQDMLWRACHWRMIVRIFSLYIFQFLIFLPALLLLLSHSFFMETGNDANSENTLTGVIASVYLAGVILAVFAMYFFLRMYLAKGIILTKNIGTIAAIKQSFAATHSNVWRLIGLLFVNMSIVFVSLIPLGIGLIWALPYVFISYGVAYDKLMSAHGQ